MHSNVGKVLIFKQIDVGGVEEGTGWRDVTDEFEGASYNQPRITGRFIEVEVIRNFRVTETRELSLEELDRDPE